jgi:hypothetical protein
VVRPRRRGRLGVPSQASNSRLISSRESLSRCSTPAVAVLHFPVTAPSVPAGRAPDQPERHDPRIQCVLTQWMSGSMASGSGPSFMAPAPPSRSAGGRGPGRQQHHGPSAENTPPAFDLSAGPRIVRFRLMPVDAEFAGSCRLLIPGAFVTMACGRCTNGFTNCCGEICVTVARPPARRRGGGTPDDRARKPHGAAAPASR